MSSPRFESIAGKKEHGEQVQDKDEDVALKGRL